MDLPETDPNSLFFIPDYSLPPFPPTASSLPPSFFSFPPPLPTLQPPPRRKSTKPLKRPRDPSIKQRKLSQGMNWGIYSIQEEERFITALELYGRDWKSLETYIGTRDVKSIQSHAQKYFIKLYKEGKELPAKVRESGEGYTLSGKCLDLTSGTARQYLKSGKRKGRGKENGIWRIGTTVEPHMLENVPKTIKLKIRMPREEQLIVCEEVLMLVKLHAHLLEKSVIGLLLGTIDENEKVTRIENILFTEEVNARQEAERCGISIVGWYGMKESQQKVIEKHKRWKENYGNGQNGAICCLIDAYKNDDGEIWYRDVNEELVPISTNIVHQPISANVDTNRIVSLIINVQLCLMDMLKTHPYRVQLNARWNVVTFETKLEKILQIIRSSLSVAEQQKVELILAIKLKLGEWQQRPM